MVMDVVSVVYEGNSIGALSFDTDLGYGSFQYTPDFIRRGVELSPLQMPLSDQIYSFPSLSYETFKGLPGLIADSLPDDFGNRVLNAWVASRGRQPDTITPLERLKYTGTRGMGALEYLPAESVRGFNASHQVEIIELIRIAQDVLDSRAALDVNLADAGCENKESMMALLSVGTSAGGARPKAVLAFNKDFTQVRSGQTQVPPGFTHYLMKFDGVSEHNPNKETFGDPLGFGAMEYVYHLMAIQCGIDMMPCKLLPEGNRQHFITQRFDRVGNQKLHVQTLNGLAHVDYKMPGSFSYAEILAVARKLRLSHYEAEQIFKRMVFNIVARNHDDHAKNFGFILKDSEWALAPAYDLAYSYKPGSKWVNSHWMSLNGKRDDFTLQDFTSLESHSKIFSANKIKQMIEQTTDVVSGWRKLAIENSVPKLLIDMVQQNLRLNLI